MAAGDRTQMLLSMVRQRLAEPTEGFFSDDEIIAYLNEAQYDLCLQLNDSVLTALQSMVTGTLTLDDEPYELPNDFLRERAVLYKGIVARRWHVHRLEDLLAEGDVYSRASESTPAWCLWENKLWLFAGTKTAGSYTLYYYRRPDKMSLVVDPTLGPEIDGLLELFVVSRLHEKAGDNDQSEALYQQYLARCALINTRYTGQLPADNIPGDRRAD